MALHDPTADDIAVLAALAGPGGCVAGDSADAAPWLAEPRDRHPGRAAAILRPRATEAVAAIVAACAARRIGIVPWSGGTGLVGGQTLSIGPRAVVLSLDRMDRIRDLALDDAALIAEAGVTLAAARAAAAAAGRLFPLSMASEGSCRIGGNLATNAGGVGVLRHGNARDLCLGVEAVLPDGAILRGLSTLRKDNTGYDLRHLLIGAEGTLGIITAATLKLSPAPGETVTALAAVPSPAAAVTLLHALREGLGDTLTAFELISDTGIGFLAETMPQIADPLPGRPAWRVLVETSGPSGADLAARAATALAAAAEDGLIGAAILATSLAQSRAIWAQREAIPLANRRIGAVSNHDIAVPISRLARFIEDTPPAVARLDPTLRINCFGHLGDGNLHYNVFPPPGRSRAEFEALRPALKSLIHDAVAACGGSISAEHGIGRAKTADLERYADPVKLATMRTIKAALDPHGIMNPGAVLA